MILSRKRKLNKGLSLVEIVAVIAVVAIIALVAINRFASVNESARVATLETSFNAMRTAATLHGAQTGGQLPIDARDLARHFQNIEVPAGGWATPVPAQEEIGRLFASIGGAAYIGGAQQNPGPNPVYVRVMHPDTVNGYRFTVDVVMINLSQPFANRVGNSGPGFPALVGVPGGEWEYNSGLVAQPNTYYYHLRFTMP